MGSNLWDLCSRTLIAPTVWKRCLEQLIGLRWPITRGLGAPERSSAFGVAWRRQLRVHPVWVAVDGLSYDQVSGIVHARDRECTLLLHRVLSCDQLHVDRMIQIWTRTICAVVSFLCKSPYHTLPLAIGPDSTHTWHVDFALNSLVLVRREHTSWMAHIYIYTCPHILGKAQFSLLMCDDDVKLYMKGTVPFMASLSRSAPSAQARGRSLNWTQIWE
jgi:hypothetical protein